MKENKKLLDIPGGVAAALGLLAIAGAAGSLLLGPAAILSGAAAFHLFLAAGVLPLILAAMAHFIPVLTRTAPRHGDLRPALLGLLAGLLAVGGQQLWFPLLYPAAALAAAAALDLLVIAHRRARACLGPPHPGLRWYQAALGCLVAGLAAIGLAYVWPTQWAAARLAHLHLNLLGFVGLTTFSTLQVLLPTAAGYSDPTTRARLAADLPWALGATLAIAAGAAAWAPLTWLGLAVWLVLTARLLAHLQHQPVSLRRGHRAESALLVALWGWLANLLFAPYHALRPEAGANALWLLVGAFLLPLISAALSHLVPVWLSPGRESPQRRRCQTRLARHSLARAMLFAADGCLQALGVPGGGYLALAGIGWFLIRGALALARWSRT